MGCRAAVGLLSFLLVGCPGPPDPPPPPEIPQWSVVLDSVDLDRAVLSVWGPAPDQLFVVGGPLGNDGFEALALSYDAKQDRWKDLRAGGSDGFWWVNGSSSTDVWMVGENGRISHFDGNAFTEHTSGTTATVWGVWAFSPKEAWAVAGTPGGGTDEPNDVVLHYDGSAWTPVTLPGMPKGVSLYKVWGTSSDDLYVVGEKGTIWHKQGSDWTDEGGLAKGTLFTVFGCYATEIYAVGGQDVLKSAGDGTWTKQDVDNNSSVNGVSCSAPGEVVLAGSGGLKQRLVDGEWVDEFTKRPFDDLHAAWAGGGGEFWVVGGDFFSSPSPDTRRAGVVARFGVGDTSGDVLP